jgi:hypothetical protein
MEAKMVNDDGPTVFVEGVDEIIRRDLVKHKGLLEKRQIERLAFNEAVGHAIAKKKYYRDLIGGGKYNDDALKTSIKDQNINIRHLQDKVKLARDGIEHETLIVDTLTEQLKQYESNYAAFYRRV